MCCVVRNRMASLVHNAKKVAAYRYEEGRKHLLLITMDVATRKSQDCPFHFHYYDHVSYVRSHIKGRKRYSHGLQIDCWHVLWSDEMRTKSHMCLQMKMWPADSILAHRM